MVEADRFVLSYGAVYSLADIVDCLEAGWTNPKIQAAAAPWPWKWKAP